MSENDREARLYRKLSLFVGAIYLLWWFAVEAILPHAFNPFFGRALVVSTLWGLVGASYLSAWVRRHLRTLWAGCLWLLTAHYYYLLHGNAGDINWIVGAFITVSAVTLAMLSRSSLIAYAIFTCMLSLTVVVALPPLRDSVFLPGVVTVLLQANIGLHSRLKTMDDLAVSNAHFQLLFHSTFEGVLIHEQGRIVQVNDTLCHILGWAADELIGQDILLLFHADARAAVGRLLETEVLPAQQVRGLRKDGSSADLELRSKPLPDARRRLRLVTLQDVSERERQAAALTKANAALERSNTELQRFAYVASHDLQTPLRSIASFVELLAATYGEHFDAQGKDWVSRTSQSVKQLQALIQDLLEYSRLDARAQPFQTVSMREVVTHATTLLDADVRQSGAQITCADLPDVAGDRSQLVQLMLNLLGNAIKYRAEAPPVIHVASESRRDEHVFTVKDNGIGIAQKHHDKVFDLFKRLHDAKEYPGTGIGLALCRRVVQGHGGRIWVESAEGQGSIFVFTIAKGTIAKGTGT